MSLCTCRYYCPGKKGAAPCYKQLQEGGVPCCDPARGLRVAPIAHGTGARVCDVHSLYWDTIGTLIEFVPALNCAMESSWHLGPLFVWDAPFAGGGTFDVTEIKKVIKIYPLCSSCCKELCPEVDAYYGHNYIIAGMCSPCRKRLTR